MRRYEAARARSLPRTDGWRTGARSSAMSRPERPYSTPSYTIATSSTADPAAGAPGYMRTHDNTQLRSEQQQS